MKKRKNEFYAGSKKKKSPVIPAILVILAAVLVGFGCFSLCVFLVFGNFVAASPYSLSELSTDGQHVDKTEDKKDSVDEREVEGLEKTSAGFFQKSWKSPAVYRRKPP